MDKNKNRTDLLAAGRKKLQQYRQKKDGKGSKSSGKANKPDPDVITDESSSVAKPTKGKKQSPVPVQDSATELVDSSNTDMGTPDISSTSDLPTDVSETDVSINTSVSDENLQSSSLNDAMPTDLSLKAIDIEGKLESDYVSVAPDDNFAGKSVDVKAACGEDQVPDVGAMQELAHSLSEPDNMVSLIHIEEDTKMEYANSAAEQTIAHELQSSGPGSTIQSKEGDVAGSHDDGGVKWPHRSGDSEFIPVSLTQLAKALQLLSEEELKFVMAAREAVNDGDMKSDSVELPERLREQLYVNTFEKELTYLQLCEEWDARKKIDYENKVFSEELAACSSELDRVRGEMEKLQVELKRSKDQLSNVSSELVDSKNLLSELQLKQENLSVNVFSLTEEKHELEKEKEDLNLENEKFKKELMECKSLLELSQVENVNTKESLAKLEDEKEKYVAEYEHFVKENKKFSMELLESQDLVECLRSEIAKLNENLELVTKEETRLGEEVNRLTVEKKQALAELTNCQSLLELSHAENANLNEQFVHSSKKVSLELSESQHLVEGLQEKIAKLSENLDLVATEKTRLEEEVNHLTVEKEEKEGFVKEYQKFSMELSESQDLVESLRLEIAKLNENLVLVTKEETRVKDEVNQLTVEKEEALIELTNCRSLLELSHAETTSLNEQFAQSSKEVSFELSESQQLVEKVHAEIAKSSENLDFVTKEKTRLVEEVNRLTVEKEEKDKNFSLELLESQDSVESLRSEIAKLNEKLELVTKEETRLEKEVKQLTAEKEAALTELTNCRSLLELSHAENANLNEQFALSSKEVSLEYVESQHLVESLHAEIAKSSENLDFVTKEKTRLGDEVNCLTVEKEEKDDFVKEIKKLSMELLESQDLVKSLHSEIATLNENLELVTKEETKLKEEVNQLTVEKEEALIELTNCRSLLELSHAENANLNEQFVHSSKKVSLELSESQHLVERLHAEIIKSSENLDLVTKEKIKLGEEVNRLTVEKEEALTELTNCKALMNDLQVEYEETFLKNVILDEYVKQYALTVEAKKGELVILCDNFNQEMITTRTKNSELTEKLSNYESRIQELQAQVDELQNQADHMTEKNKDLESTNELASYVIRKVFDNLQKLVEDSGPSTEQSEDDTANEQLDHLEISNYDVFIEKQIMVLHERAQLESKNRDYNLELLRRMKDMDALNKRCINPDVIFKFFEDIQSSVTLTNIEIKPDEPLSSLESIIHFLVKSSKFNETKVTDLQNEIDHLTSSIVSFEVQSHVLKGSLITAMEQIVNFQSDTQLKETELGQSEQRVSALREKLHIAVTKGKGLIQQRESLKQNLAATSNELEKCKHELQLKDATLQETEAKLRTYSEAGERMEALESELSYIRNSATALRESFLLKDSVLQRIEEILEDLDLPEDFHVRDIIDKIDWLAKSVSQSQKSFPASNQAGTIERTRSYPESGSRALDGWREVLEPSSGFDEELRRNYEEFQNKFYGLAEQNEMLEQSLMERNNLVQRWEEALDKINMPSQFRSLEAEDKIEWLRVALLESNDRRALLQQDISELEKTRESLAADLEESQRRLADLESTLKVISDEREQLSASLEAQGPDYNKISEKAALNETEIEKLQNKVSILHSKLEKKRVDEEYIHYIHGEIRRFQDLVKETLQASEIEDLDSNTSDIQCLEGLLRKLVDKHITVYEERSVDQSNIREELERNLETVEGDLVQVKDERERLVEKSLTLTNEIKALEVNNQELNNLLVQEEQKSSTVKEELERKLEAVESDLVQVKDERERLVEKSQTFTNEVEALVVKNQELKNLLVQEEKKTATVKDELERKLEAVESGLVQVKDERERLVEKSQTLTNEIEALVVKNQELKNLLVQEEKKTATVKEELERKLEAVKGDLVQVKDERDRLMEKSQTLTSEVEALVVKNQELKNLLVQEEKTATVKEELERKLEEVEGDLVQVQDERERLMEKSQTLTSEVEALEVKNQELKNLLVQEEQKTAAIKEKLNVAVRRGKSLVQVRDSMKQTINDLTSQVDRLNGEIKVRENTILEFQNKMKDLFVSQELVENKDSEIEFLKNRLEESENELLDKRNTMGMILGALAEIDLGVDSRTNDPFEKMKQIEKVIQDLQAATTSAEQDSRKSKRAAELLLAELNEVQERNEDLLEEISELSRQRDSAEASKHESLTRFEQLSALHSEERSSQFSELLSLKSSLEQLTPGLSKIYNLLNNVLPKDLENLYNLEAGVKSLLESTNDTSNVAGQTLNSSRSESKANVQFKSFLDSKTEELHNENTIIDLWRFVGSHMQDLITNINSFEERLQSHSKSLHEEAILLCEKVPTLFKEITSHKHTLESAKEEIAWLESTGKQKETENLMLRKSISILYEACKNSVLEIEKSKGQMAANDSFAEDILKSGETDSISEGVTSIVNRLLLAVKDLHSIQTENVEVELKEMKATISNLQKELTEKDVQKDRISVELVSQIKRAEASAMSHLQELESAKDHINELKGQCNLLAQRVQELEGQESVLVDLHEKVKSLTEAMTAKEQENEALLQALDEEEAQMEDLTNKITELEQLLKQKNIDLKSADSARGKALKKLSVTVSKFDELHHLSETLVSEVDKLQSQLQERDSEVSFLRDEITRITSDSLQALKTDERSLTEIQDILSWLESTTSGVETRDVNLDDNKNDQVQEYKELLKKQITNIVSELKDIRQVAQSKDDQLHTERSKVDELMRSLREKESRLSFHENEGSSAQPTSVTSEIVEVEPLLNKWPSQGTSMAPQVRSLRKVNNDQLAISIDDMDLDDRDKLDDEDDDKAHGFKSLTTSKLVPRFTRPVTDFVDGLWVSCDRTLMRQPVLRLSLIFYWAVIHALLAAFVV